MHCSPGSTRKSQKYLGDCGLIALIALLSAFVPLSTDLYLPALPGMGDYFGVSASLTNLTLILFFLFFSLDCSSGGRSPTNTGRRPVLLVGLALYIAASAGCAASLAIWHLIAFRILQAVGERRCCGRDRDGQDVYDGRKRESVLALVQSMVVISPAVAPILGAFLLHIVAGPLRGACLIGVVSMIGGLLLQETIPRGIPAPWRNPSADSGRCSKTPISLRSSSSSRS